MRMKNSLFLFLSAVFLLAGCRKDGGDETPSPFLSISIQRADSNNPPTIYHIWITNQRVEKIERVSYDGTTKTETYSYFPDFVVCTSYNGTVTTYNLNRQGLCTRVEYSDGTVEDVLYNSENHVVQFGKETFEWHDDNLVKATGYLGEDSVTWDITYEGIKVNPYKNDFDWYHVGAFFFIPDLMIIGLGGLPNKELATKAVSSKGSNVIWEYSFDKKGRVKTRKEIWDEIIDIYTYSYYD